jgi:large subunit ribosomal protein L21
MRDRPFGQKNAVSGCRFGAATSRQRFSGSDFQAAIFRQQRERPSVMFAVISDGNRQYRVQEGDTLLVDYRDGVEEGNPLRFEQVLLANAGGSSAIGKPAISGAIVEATVLNPEVKGPKLEIGKFRRRKNSRRHTGHRQHYTAVKITAITVPGLEVAEKGAEEKGKKR